MFGFETVRKIKIAKQKLGNNETINLNYYLNSSLNKLRIKGQDITKNAMTIAQITMTIDQITTERLQFPFDAMAFPSNGMVLMAFPLAGRSPCLGDFHGQLARDLASPPKRGPGSVV